MMIEVKKTNCDWSSKDSGDLTKHCYVTMISYFVLQGLVKLRYAKLLASLYILFHMTTCVDGIFSFTWTQGSLNILRCIHLQVATTSVNNQCLHKTTQWTQITSYLLSIFHSFPYIPTIYKIEITQQSVICF